MHLYTYGKDNRHVLVTEEEVGSESVQAFWVCLNPEVDGVARRGRPPGSLLWKDGVRSLKVTEDQVTSYEASDEVAGMAEKVLSQVVEFNSEQSQEAAA